MKHGFQLVVVTVVTVVVVAVVDGQPLVLCDSGRLLLRLERGGPQLLRLLLLVDRRSLAGRS